jgi:hypothetical protein
VLRMCRLPAARSSSNRGRPTTRSSCPTATPTRGRATLVPVGLPLAARRYGVIPLGPGSPSNRRPSRWVARYVLVRPLPHQHQRVVFRRIREQPAS